SGDSSIHPARRRSCDRRLMVRANQENSWNNHLPQHREGEKTKSKYGKKLDMSSFHKISSFSHPLYQESSALQNAFQLN
ncbi:hypothetical protein LL965_18685, partial [Xanthomonas cassavae CFBP 4642]